MLIMITGILIALICLEMQFSTHLCCEALLQSIILRLHPVILNIKSTTSHYSSTHQFTSAAVQYERYYFIPDQFLF